MLNLSDKELDRFSQEAAQEYEPGNVLEPRSWDRLEVRMTQEFGRRGWNPISHIRRFPFVYAPALLLLLGVGYYLVRPGVSSGSSPGVTAKATVPKASVQTQNPSSTDKATSTPTTSSAMSDSLRDGAAAPAAGSATATAGAASGSGAAGARAGAGASAGSGAAAGAGARAAAGAGARAGAAAGVRAGSGRSRLGGTGGSGLMAAGKRTGSGGRRANGNNADNRSTDNTVALTVPLDAGHGNGVKPERELSLSAVQRPGSLAKKGVIGDSALRAFNAKTGAPVLIRRKGIYRINRNWQFGLEIAPDFTSVNSLAGDKAGSSIGLTVDYQLPFASHWYVSTGILATRRNYAARAQDYHAPPMFFQQNNIYNGGLNFVKGSFYMMEIPLNLRYDFSVAGSTLFFISAGSSSYLMTTENANVYWRHLSVDECSPVDHLPIHRTNLFSTVNLSVGVETGLSNSLSLLIAPYTKLPTKNLGMGQVQMNSVGINFALKWSPVTSRGRH